MTEHEFAKYSLLHMKIGGYMSDTDTSISDAYEQIIYGVRFSKEDCTYAKPEDEYTYPKHIERYGYAGTVQAPVSVDLYYPKEELPNIQGYMQPYVKVNGIMYPFKGCCITISYANVSTQNFSHKFFVEGVGGSEIGDRYADLRGDGTPCQPFLTHVVKPLKLGFGFPISAKYSNTQQLWDALQQFDGATLYFKATDLSGATTYKERTEVLSLENSFIDNSEGYIKLGLDEVLFNTEDVSQHSYRKFLLLWNIKKEGQLLAGSDTPIELGYRYTAPDFDVSLFHNSAHNVDQVLYQLEATPAGFTHMSQTTQIEVRVETSTHISGESWTSFATKNIVKNSKNPVVYGRTSHLPRDVRRVRVRFKVSDNCYIYSKEIQVVRR